MEIQNNKSDETISAYNGESHLDDLVPDWCRQQVSCGTSLMAVEFNGGVVLGADSRVTSRDYVPSRVTDKLTRLTDHIYCCHNGKMADTQAISDAVAHHLNFYEMESGEPPSVKTAANIFRETCYNYRDSINAGFICAGYDKRDGGQVYEIPLGGMLIRHPVAIAGYGSNYIYGFVDANYRPNMTEHECIQFVTSGLALAMSRDGYSGGVVRIGVITKDGTRRLTVKGDELPKFYEG